MGSRITTCLLVAACAGGCALDPRDGWSPPWDPVRVADTPALGPAAFAELVPRGWTWSGVVIAQGPGGAFGVPGVEVEAHDPDALPDTDLALLRSRTDAAGRFVLGPIAPSGGGFTRLLFRGAGYRTGMRMVSPALDAGRTLVVRLEPGVASAPPPRPDDALPPPPPGTGMPSTARDHRRFDALGRRIRDLEERPLRERRASLGRAPLSGALSVGLATPVHVVGLEGAGVVPEARLRGEMRTEMATLSLHRVDGGDDVRVRGGIWAQRFRLRYGWRRDIEVRGEVAAALAAGRLRWRRGGAPVVADRGNEVGVGDIVLGVRARVLSGGEAGTGLNAGLDIKFPTGDRGALLSTGDHDVAFVLAGTERIDRLHLHASLAWTEVGSYAVLRQPEDQFDVLAWGLGATWPLDPRPDGRLRQVGRETLLLLGLRGQTSPFRGVDPIGRNAWVIEGGLRRRTGTWDLEGALGRGIGGPAPDLLVGFGVSRDY